MTPNNAHVGDDHIATCSQHIPGPAMARKDFHESPEGMARLCQHLSTMSDEDNADAGGPEVMARMSRDDIFKRARVVRKDRKDKLTALETENAALKNQNQEMSRSVPKALDPDSIGMARDAAQIEFSSLVADGHIDPATRDRLLPLLLGTPDKPNLLALSRTANPNGDTALVFAVARALRGNKPVPKGGSKSGLQALSRDVPDEAATAKEAKAAAEFMAEGIEK